MTRDDIIRMAREAGIRLSKDVWPWEGEAEEALERFAALVAAAERQACRKICVEVAYSNLAMTEREIILGLVCADAIEASVLGIPVEEIIAKAMYLESDEFLRQSYINE